MTPEQVKLYHDTFKHLATLSTGAVVVSSVLLTSPERATKTITALAIICLILANTLSIVIMFSLAKYTSDSSEKEKKGLLTLMKTGESIVLIMFTIALGCFGAIGLHQFAH